MRHTQDSGVVLADVLQQPGGYFSRAFFVPEGKSCLTRAIVLTTTASELSVSSGISSHCPSEPSRADQLSPSHVWDGWTFAPSSVRLSLTHCDLHSFLTSDIFDSFVC